jgi:hypothetical protein
LDEEKANENHQTPAHYIYEEESKPIINIDVLNSNTIVSSRRRPKRRLINRLNRQISEDDEQDIFNQFASLKRRSRARKRDSTPITRNKQTVLIPSSTNVDRFRSSIQLLRKRSASENDLLLFQFENELTPFVDAHSRFNSIDNRPKTLHFNETDEDDLDQKYARSLSNPIAIEQIHESPKTLEESDTLNSSILSKSAPVENINTTTLRISQSEDPTGDFYSPTSSYQR